ncbi:ImmA/IrrE family metallo-endopeptidase [Isachenkonia alkalipeptolytica]|uniref:ImmA/IrrE family metallo-endopeptidase n=1 Tax=Isachenkonia alkalipeptolytica TaxID=2565777 RepID=A0AA44BDP1_9CLOT|nr:ImmA/IrrE family metallo-endopeptidase [Isachenkonia alkalipeptolytica]NBG88108.1 ImmA/IrrE family metallo-endopeptidase [Isachenkonia alkalipeptolytica]
MVISRSKGGGKRNIFIKNQDILKGFPACLSNTFGDKEFPSELINPFQTKGEISNQKRSALEENLKSYGVFYTEADLGTAGAGWIQRVNSGRKLIIKRTKKEITVKTLYNMVINKNHPSTTKFATMLHELGHLYCGHLGAPYDKWWKDRRGLSCSSIEFEAESVCWIICERLGIHNPSAEYLSGYLSKNEEIPAISIDSVLKAVGIIESMLRNKIEPKKEIILQ